MNGDRAANISRLEEALNKFIRSMNSAVTVQQELIPGPALSGSQRIVLRHLANNGPCPVSEVANQLRVTLSAATGLVDRLVKAKLVTRDRDQNDRRVVWVKITADGEAAVQAAETRRRAALSQISRTLSADELSQLCDLLERLE